MGSQTGPLPAHMLIGRGSASGPNSGAYVTFCIATDAIANSATLLYQFAAPFDMRIEDISIAADTVTSDPTVDVLNGASALVSAANFPAADTPTSLTLVAAQRTVTKGTKVTVTYTADSGDAATSVMLVITAYTRGHVQADPAND